MKSGIGLVILAGIFVTAYGFSLREIAEFLLGGGYGHYPTYPGHGPGQYPGNYPSGPGSYPGNYPSGPGNYPGNYPSGPGSYPGNYPSGPGNYPGNYPSHPGVVGEPGAHPGCPLCDSSVYGYCSHKQIHDACCCENPSLLPFNCRNKDCKFLYANSCQEYGLITNCCCIDLQKQNVAPAVAVVG